MNICSIYTVGLVEMLSEALDIYEFLVYNSKPRSALNKLQKLICALRWRIRIPHFVFLKIQVGLPLFSLPPLIFHIYYKKKLCTCKINMYVFYFQNNSFYTEFIYIHRYRLARWLEMDYAHYVVGPFMTRI